MNKRMLCLSLMLGLTVAGCAGSKDEESGKQKPAQAEPDRGPVQLDKKEARNGAKSDAVRELEEKRKAAARQLGLDPAAPNSGKKAFGVPMDKGFKE